MAIAAEAFKVVTEFVFQAALADAEVGRLQNSVQGLSDVAERAVASVQSLGINFALQFAGLGGGILGLLGSAITASDSFTNSQLQFTNLFSANIKNLTGDIATFNDQMRVSKVILGDISRDAIKFGIPVKELEGLTKFIAGFLLPKGLAGENVKAARDISRNLLKSAPILGINPTFAGNQLARSISGEAAANNPVFSRLLQEAPEPFREAGVTTAKQFNVLDIAKRFSILNEAMAKFSSNTQVLTARANTLSGIMQRIENLFSGVSSILKPLGDVILPPLVELLNIGIKLLETKGRKIIEEMALFIEPFLRNPEQLIIGLLQVTKLSEDVGTAASIAGAVLMLIHLKELTVFLASLPFLGGAVIAIQAFIARSAFLTGAMLLLSKAGLFLKGVFGGGLFRVITRISLLFLGLTVILQALSRGADLAKLDSAKVLVDRSPEIAKNIRRIKEAFFNIVQPIQDVIEGLAILFSKTILNTSLQTGVYISLLGTFGDAIEFVANIINTSLAVMRGGMAAMLSLIANVPIVLGQVIDSLKNLDFQGAGSAIEIGMINVLEDSIDEFSKTLNRNIGNIGKDEGTEAVVNNVTNNSFGDVNITNSFKEGFQPDRVAFTIKDQLMKAAQNPTTIKGRTLSGALSR